WACEDPKWLVFQRMHHSDLGSMQHRAWRVPHTVEPVTDDRMPDCCQMHANLMCSPGLQFDRDQRSIGRCAQRPDRGQRALALLAHPERNRTDARHRRVDGLLFGELAFAQGEVALADLLRLELTPDPRVYFGALGGKDHAARSAIEPLHQKELACVLLRHIEG